MTPQAYREMACAQDVHWWYAARRKILRRQIASLGLVPDAEILEVGCGTGANLALLAEFGRVTGLEMASEAIGLAQEHGASFAAVRLLQGRCPDDLDRLNGSFDLICLFDVLEHLDDDSLSLSRLSMLLKPGGRLLLTVPAYRWMWGPHDEHHHHRRRYDCNSLAQASRVAGLSVDRMTHFNALLFPLACANRLFERATGRCSKATTVPAHRVNALLERVFAWEGNLLDRFSLPYGLSLMLVAHPRR